MESAGTTWCADIARRRTGRRRGRKVERAPDAALESKRPLDLITMSSYPIADFYAQVLSPAQQPLVRVITPGYNGEDFLGECIERVLPQTYQKRSHTIVHNPRTDRTPQMTSRHAASSYE